MDKWHFDPSAYSPPTTHGGVMEELEHFIWLHQVCWGEPMALEDAIAYMPIVGQDEAIREAVVERLETSR